MILTKPRFSASLATIVVPFLAVAGCGKASEPSPDVEATVEAQATAEPTFEAITPTPTATSAAVATATPTRSPTAAPSPTPTPTYTPSPLQRRFPGGRTCIGLSCFPNTWSAFGGTGSLTRARVLDIDFTIHNDIVGFSEPARSVSDARFQCALILLRATDRRRPCVGVSRQELDIFEIGKLASGPRQSRPGRRMDAVVRSRAIS